MSTEKTQINIVAIGQVDSGKSTILGHLLYKCGGVEKEIIDNLKNEASEIGKGSFKYAWVFDKLRAERDRGITIDISQKKIETPKHNVTIIDTPGHQDYIKNFLTGVSQADCALVVVSADDCKFNVQTVITKGNEIREQILGANYFGIKKIIVVINKMDSVNWSKECYTEIVVALQRIIQKANYNPFVVPIIPISGWNSDNLIEPSANSPWFQDMIESRLIGCSKATLLDAIDSIEAPARPNDRPLRIPIEDVYNIENIGAVSVGCIASGFLKPGMSVTFVPISVTSEVNSIEMHNEPLSEAMSGDNIGFNVDNIDASEIKRGYVAGQFEPNNPLIVSSFVVQITIINHPGLIRSGYTPVIDCHTAHVACKFAELISQLERRTGRVIKQNSKHIQNGDSALVKLTPSKPMFVEKYSDCPSLGRLVIRDFEKIVAFGIIKSVERSHEFKPLN